MVDIDNRLNTFLATAIKHKASDLHLKPDTKPHIRIEGRLRPLGSPQLSELDCSAIILSMLDENRRKALKENLEIDFALELVGIGRFRVNTFMAQGQYEAVIRVISPMAKTLEELALPEALESLALLRDGLILVAGPTGSGKSSTLAAMIDIINANLSKRIITIENPVEILHSNKKSLITQREIGIDTYSFSGALRATLRQDPDVIMVGEIRDKETADAAIQAAQTGHLVLSTIHAGNTEEALSRLAGLFPLGDRDNINETLSTIIKGIVVQKLLMDVNQHPIPAVEIMTNSSRMQDFISGKTRSASMQTIIEESSIHGMQTMDAHIVNLVMRKKISYEVAVQSANHVQWVTTKLKELGIKKPAAQNYPIQPRL